MKRFLEIQPVASIPEPGTPVGLYEFGGTLYAITAPGGPAMFVGSSAQLPTVQAPDEQKAAGITPDHLIKLAAVLLQPGTVSDLYSKVES